jgi:hypothetical protein
MEAKRRPPSLHTDIGVISLAARDTGGGFAPIVATALMERFHASVFIAGYAAVLCAITVGSVLLLGQGPQTAGPAP